MLSMAQAEELPVPTLINSVIVSIEHSVTDAAEVAYIKNNFPWGLYAWLSFSRTAVYPVLAWQSDWNNADTGIQAFKNEVNNLIAAAEAAEVRLHPVLVSGLSRILWIYRDAKIEDIRNAQWYNDNKIASDTQILDANVMNKYVFGTLSRYARKMRRNLESKAKAALAFLKQRLDEKSHVLVTASGWGEVELNFGRIDQTKSLQDWFCDYSPFAVMEFRDWICHTGMYDESSGAYQGQGYPAGGSRYQGTNGLAQFNADFGTSFTTWDLKYYNWNLLDDWDEDPRDDVNNDPGRIPYSSYVQGGMMPNSGPYFISGGLDPPRTMTPGNAFWDLWNLFRESMVQNFILDMARWSYEAGIPAGRWYSHQIPADYLFGTNPSMPSKNPRYYTSASPLWTADVLPFGSAGATIYDIKFPEWFARTTDYALSAISDMSSNWAILEYDAETYPQGMGVTQSSVDSILAQFLNVYGFNPHLINFWRWMDASGDHQIKGMNKEAALREFVRRIRDKARQGVSTVFTPPKVADIAVVYVAETGKVRVSTDGKIWSGQTWMWRDWGDFSRFEIHRGTSSGFTVGAGSLIGTTSDYSYDDGTVVFGNIYYYRMRAVNSKGQAGPLSDEIMIITSSGPVAVLSVDKTSLFFAAVQGGNSTAPQKVVISNTGGVGTVLNWTVTKDVAWLSATPSSGTGGSILNISVIPSGLGPGTYTGHVRVEAPAAFRGAGHAE